MRSRLVVAVIVALLACACDRGTATIAPSAASSGAIDSNIDRADYVGPVACAVCHPDNFKRWRSSTHSTMNQRAEDRGAVVGDFADAQLEYAGGKARFSHDGNRYVMALTDGAQHARRYRVTRTIGTRFLQEYVGVDEDDRKATEIRLPFGYSPRAHRWLPQPYFDSWYGAEYNADGTLAVSPYQPDTTPWATRCAWCHNTSPFEIRAVRSTARPIGYGLEQYFDLVRSQRSMFANAAIAEGNLLPTNELVTVGVSCESCHLGGRDHADGGDHPIHFVPTSNDLALHGDAPDLSGGRNNKTVVTSICAQCHSTPAAHFPNGGVTRNSSEALDMAAGTCTSKIKCTDCHDPHSNGPGAGAPDQPAHIAACVGCHNQFADAVDARKHSGHDGVSCLDCHMPKIVQGLGGFVRTHRISSPSDPSMLAAAAPNACNLCHLDRSITWTLDALETMWHRRVTPIPSWNAAYGGVLDAPVGPMWLASKDATIRITAAAAYARAPVALKLRTGALPQLLAILDDPIAYDRMWILYAVQDLLGRSLSAADYDPVAPPAERARQVDALRTAMTR